MSLLPDRPLRRHKTRWLNWHGPLQWIQPHARLILDRLRRQGLRRTAGWLLEKTVFRRWSAVVFFEPGRAPRQPGEWPADYRYAPPVPVARLAAGDLLRLASAGHQDLPGQLGADDEMYWVTCDDQIVCVGAALHNSPQCHVLGLPVGTVLIGHCSTQAAHRQKGLYSLAINDTLMHLAQRGRDRVFMETHPENLASRKGILKAGMEQDREVHAAIFFRSLVVRRDGVEWIRRP